MAKGIENRARSPPSVFDFATSQIQKHGGTKTPEPVQPAATESSADDKELLLKLLQNPEMAALLKSLAKTL